MTTSRDTLLDTIGHIERSRLAYAARLAARAREMMSAYTEDYDGVPSAKALANLLAFCEAGSVVEYTYLTLTPDGGWYMEWLRPNDRKVSIQFCDSGETRYLMLNPNPVDPAKLDYLEGATTAEALRVAIRPWPIWTELAA